jgi:hypothetical protein
MEIRTREHRSARAGESLGGASAYVSLQRDKAASPSLGGGVKARLRFLNKFL